MFADSPSSPPLGRRRSAALAALAAASLLAAACSSSGGDSTGGGASGGAGGSGGEGAGRPSDPPITEDLQGRTYDLKVPSGYDEATAAPLLVMLHGFTDANTNMDPGGGMDAYMKISPEADKRGIFVAIPLGSKDPVLNHWFWNATDSCCDFDGLKTNDIGYLMAMVTEIEGQYNIDKKRIFVLGHSNGGFMAHRIACDQADRIAAIVSLAGATYKNPEKCAASAPIAVLQVHGDADMTVPYEGGAPEGIAVLPPAPGAVDTASLWADKNRCKPTPDSKAPAIDLVTDLDGTETHKAIYSGCEGNGGTELWTISGGPHSPHFSDAWAPAVFDFLMAHPKP